MMTTDQTAQHVLAVDVGNSRIKIGLYHSNANPSAKPFDIRKIECLESLAVVPSERIDWSVIDAWQVTHSQPEFCIVAGSNPERLQSLRASIPAELPPPIEIDHYTKIPIDVRVDYPERVGIDRLLNSFAVTQLKSPIQPAIAISSGTATTVDVISTDGAFEGGTILPGFELCAHALHRYTSLLPLIELEALQTDPPRAIGKNTEAAMLSGLFWGEVGAIEKILQLQMQDLEETPDVFLTGGAAPLIAPHLTMDFQNVPNLALLGLVSIGLMETGNT